MAPWPPQSYVPQQYEQLLAAEGPTTEEVRIIGVELCLTRNGNREVELEMFACRHTLPRNPYGNDEVRVTLHTSAGDFTLRGNPRW